MRAETQLNSAVFQLTPTRTRCDLVIFANGKTEKIASGLLNPFVSHLKTAQDQISKGGYSIKLEPDPECEAAWFTKGTVERFVRFVSTPEVLERVNTIESEILQIEEEISRQGNGNPSQSTLEEQLKSFGRSEGIMQLNGVDSEKAIVLYKTGCHPNPAVSNEPKMLEENSKVRLVRVLETRKKVLQNEQAMAFARTAAAGFEMENMAHLMAFAESFGAYRLREACSRYMQLWEGKHESGQWIEIEAAEALSYRSEFPPLNTSGIIFSDDAVKQKELIEAWPASAGDVGMDNNGNSTSQESDRDKRLPSEPQVPPRPPFYQGQFQCPPFPQWPMHSQPSPYLLQPYPMQAMPYYQNYQVDGQFLHPSYPPMEDPKLNTHQSKGKKQHSKFSNDGSSHSDDGTGRNTSEYEEEPSKIRRSHKKVSRSGKKKGVVVVRNLNYIAAKRHETSGDKSEPSSDSEIEDIKDMIFDRRRDHRPSGSLKREDNHLESSEFSNVHGRDEKLCIQEADAGIWQAFQSFLLQAEEKMASAVDGDMFAAEKEPPVKKLQDKDGADPKEESIMVHDAVSGKGSRTRQTASADEFLTSTEGRIHLNSQADAQFKEMDFEVGGYRKDISDDFIMYGLEKKMPNKITSDPLVDFEQDYFRSSPNVVDESFVVPFRSGTQDRVGADTRFAIDMDLEFRSTQNEDISSNASTMISYEPDDLTLILEHARESESVGYNQTVDSDIQAPLIVKQESKKEEDDVLASFNEGFVRNDEMKLKSPHSELEKKRKDVSMRKTTSTRSTPPSESQKRAEKLRNYKSDLQKLKKEHEEEQLKRLEVLKRERQKKIASRNGSKAVQSPLNPHQPNSEKSSKFKGSEIGSIMPLRKLPISTVSNKGIKTTTSNKSSHVALSSSETKDSEKQEGNSVSARIRRLSEPKYSRVHSVPEKSASTNKIIKKALAEEPRSERISAIIQPDKSNSETPPELKITADRTSSEVIKNKPATKQQKVAVGRISMILESHCGEMNPDNPKLSHIEEYPLVEKTVVILENEVVPAPHAQAAEGRIDAVVKSPLGTKRESATIDVGYAAINASSSPIGRLDRENDPIDSFEKLPDPTVTDKPHQAPFARASSLEDAAIVNLKHAEASHAPHSETTVSSSETMKGPAHNVSDLSSSHQQYETQEKPQNQKGLRKLWKFGRKDHSSRPVDGTLHSYESVVDDDMMATPNDISRPFSILTLSWQQKQ